MCRFFRTILKYISSVLFEFIGDELVFLLAVEVAELEHEHHEGGIEGNIDESQEDMREALVEPVPLLVPQVDFCEFEVFAVAAPDVSIVLDDNAVEAYEKDAQSK